MVTGLRQDRGQTLPMYVVVVGGLLFLAFAYFAFAQAAVARNGGQSAADAAALAGAQEMRTELTDGFIDSFDTPDELITWLDGKGVGGAGSEAAAAQLANENDSDLVDFDVDIGELEFTANIETRFTVGDSVIPGTENTRVKADATAVVEPRCDITPGSNLVKLIEIDCEDNARWEIDPKDFVAEDLPEPQDLFFVHLIQ